MAWTIPFLGTFGATAAADAALDTIAHETAHLNSLRENALNEARRTAEAEGRAPNLTDYWHAAMNVPEFERNPRIISDLSNQRLDGFTIRREDIYPSEQTRAIMGDLYDLDQDGQINAPAINSFFNEVQEHMNFNGAQFHHVTFQPATTLEILSHAAGATFANITLDGLAAGETLTIGTTDPARGTDRETFRNVHVINDQGGTIRVASNATLYGLEIDGGRSVLEIAGGGQVNHLHVSGETVSLNVQSMGQLFMPRFEDVTFTPASSMRGAILRGDMMPDTFDGFNRSNLNGLSFENADISGIDFRSTDITRVNFAARRLSSVTFSDDMDLSTADFSGLRHATNVQIVHYNPQGHPEVLHTINSSDELRAYIANGQQRPAPAVSADPLAAAVGGVDISWHQHLRPTQAAVPEQNNAVELRQTPTSALLAGPAALPAASATEPYRAVSGGDTVVNETAAETLTRVSGQDARFQVANASLSDVTVANQSALDSAEARAARQAIAEARMEQLGLYKQG